MEGKKNRVRILVAGGHEKFVDRILCEYLSVCVGTYRVMVFLFAGRNTRRTEGNLSIHSNNSISVS